MLFLWYCLIAKPNNQERDILFTFMIIPYMKRQIQIYNETARPPPTF